MKEFRKNQQGLFICEECEKTYNAKQGLSKHVSLKHNAKEYYDKWIKNDEDDKCKICENITEFKSLFFGHKRCCSKICSTLYKKQTCIKRFGVEYSLQSKEIREKGKQTKKEKYGDKNYNNREKSKQTCLEIYGDENYNNHEKYKQTCQEKYDVENVYQRKDVKDKCKQIKLERYADENYNNREKYKETCLKNLGVEHPLQNKEIHEKFEQTCVERFGVKNPYQSKEKKEKIKETCFIKYGVEYPQQNYEIHEKGQKTRLLRKKFRNTNIWYQGSYELDFLEKYYDLFPDIKRGPTIKFKFKGKNKVYYPDFYIPSLNLIIELKNSWRAKKDKEKIKEKKRATIASGFNYMMIINKDYFEFKNELK